MSRIYFHYILNIYAFGIPGIGDLEWAIPTLSWGGYVGVARIRQNFSIFYYTDTNLIGTALKPNNYHHLGYCILTILKKIHCVT